MAGHFGKAEWLMVVEEAAQPRFIANVAANGHGVMALVRAGALMRLDAGSLPPHEGGCCCGHGKESAAATGCCSR